MLSQVFYEEFAVRLAAQKMNPCFPDISLVHYGTLKLILYFVYTLLKMNYNFRTRTYFFFSHLGELLQYNQLV